MIRVSRLARQTHRLNPLCLFEHSRYEPSFLVISVDIVTRRNICSDPPNITFNIHPIYLILIILSFLPLTSRDNLFPDTSHDAIMGSSQASTKHSGFRTVAYYVNW